MDTDQLNNLLAKASAAPRSLTRDDLAALLSVDDAVQQQLLFDAAYALKTRYVGKAVSVRGIIESGNACSKNCYYCGIRRGNGKLKRFELSGDAILRMAKIGYENGYGSLVLQSGEIESERHTWFIESVIRKIMELSSGELGITLSLGEQTEEVYRRWRDAGASRYLLRIETSSPKLYARLHPADHRWDRRVECLRALRRCGYQVGSGVMIGMPGQSIGQLADDILFYAKMDLDMIGMGPYIPHPDTPLGDGVELTPEYAARQLSLGLRAIACTRLLLHDVNIAASTALQALKDDGRELGILVGANVVMPNITDVEYRKFYQLYKNKPCLDENAKTSREIFTRRIESIGEHIAWDCLGDSPHFLARSNPAS